MSDERTKDELQEELRRRDLPVSGTKQELLDRLEEADASEKGASGGGSSSSGSSSGGGGTAESGGASGDDGGGSSRSRRGPKPMQLARRASLQLGQLTGRKVEGVAGLRQEEDDEWVVTLEVLEVSKVPNSTDVLGSYEVTIDADGDLLGYERLRRFVRGQPSEE